MPAASVELHLLECPAVSPHPAFLRPSLNAACADSEEIKTLSSYNVSSKFPSTDKAGKYHDISYLYFSICNPITLPNLNLSLWCIFSTARQNEQNSEEGKCRKLIFRQMQFLI